MVEAGDVPVAGRAAELAAAPVAEHAAGLADGGPGAEHAVALAAEFAVGVVVAAGAVPAAEHDVLVAAGLAVELADGLAELVSAGDVCCNSFLVG